MLPPTTPLGKTPAAYVQLYTICSIFSRDVLSFIFLELPTKKITKKMLQFLLTDRPGMYQFMKAPADLEKKKYFI